jgi:hypothetical protein
MRTGRGGNRIQQQLPSLEEGLLRIQAAGLVTYRLKVDPSLIEKEANELRPQEPAKKIFIVFQVYYFCFS